MEELDIPIFQKAYELYKTFHGLRGGVPKQDRFTLWQRVEDTALSFIQHILLASQRREAKRQPLEQASVELNLLRVFLRLAKDTKVIDLKKYAVIQQSVDEIGRMLGGWLKSVPTEIQQPPPPEELLGSEKEVPSGRHPHVVVGIVVHVVVDVEPTVVPVQFDAVAVGGLRSTFSRPGHCGSIHGILSAVFDSGAVPLMRDTSTEKRHGLPSLTHFLRHTLRIPVGVSREAEFPYSDEWEGTTHRERKP